MSEAPVNEQHPHQHPQLAQPERTQPVPPGRRFADEDRAWSQLYSAVLQGQPSTAEEVIKALDADPKAKHLRLALYTHAKTTLRKQKASQLRHQRIASALNSVLDFLFLAPIRLLRPMLSNGAAVAVEMMPAAKREPAKARAPVLQTEPSFVNAKQRFAAGAEAPPAEVVPEESQGAKAA
jgi:hypothetical protein